MTIYEMLFREDIYGIIEKTLEEYYKTVFQKDISVKVQGNRFGNKYVIYPRLGVIVSRSPSLKVMKDVYSQFNVQNSIIKKLVAWGYITLCFMTFGLLAPKSLWVSDKSILKRYSYILPCNRKLRIFNHSEGFVDAILKVGFNDAYFKKEIEYRSAPQFSFIPGLIQSGERWYRERIIEGHSLVRLPETEYKKVLSIVCEDIREMYQSSIEHVGAKEYCKPIVEYIYSKIDFLKKEKNIDTVEYITRVAENAFRIVSESGLDIPVVNSHGDMQTGNMCKESKSGLVYIYDWETAQRRSIWFDAGKLLLYSQRKDKYAYMVNHRNEPDVKDKILYFDSRKDYSMDVVISVLVLEELQFFIEEICDLPDAMGTEIMYRLTDELKQTTLFA